MLFHLFFQGPKSAATYPLYMKIKQSLAFSVDEIGANICFPCLFVRAFDIANHFCEWFFDYTAPHPPYFTVSDNAWPSRDQVVSKNPKQMWMLYYICSTSDNLKLMSTV